MFESIERKACGGQALQLRRTSLHHFTPYDRPLFRKTTTLLSRMGAFPLSPFSPSTCAFGCNLCAGEKHGLGFQHHTLRARYIFFFSAHFTNKPNKLEQEVFHLLQLPDRKRDKCDNFSQYLCRQRGFSWWGRTTSPEIKVVGRLKSRFHFQWEWSAYDVLPRIKGYGLKGVLNKRGLIL